MTRNIPLSDDNAVSGQNVIGARDWRIRLRRKVSPRCASDEAARARPLENRVRYSQKIVAFSINKDCLRVVSSDFKCVFISSRCICVYYPFHVCELSCFTQQWVFWAQCMFVPLKICYFKWIVILHHILRF